MRCIDCGIKCSGLRCKKHGPLRYPRNSIDLLSLTIDKVKFTAIDAGGIALPVKMKFIYNCDKCSKQYKAALGYERKKRYPWHCKSCAITLAWVEEQYREIHVRELKKANSTIAARFRRSVMSKLNWSDDNTRKRMLTRDWSAASRKGKITKMQNLISGKTKYKVPHGKRTLVGTTWMRSTYEARFATFLTLQNIEWVYEPKWFEIGSGKLYLPDFYVPSFDVYVEVKGWWRDDAKEKFDAFRMIYSNLRYALVMLDELKAFERGEKSFETCIIEARG
jgi:hypothetical protein